MEMKDQRDSWEMKEKINEALWNLCMEWNKLKVWSKNKFCLYWSDCLQKLAIHAPLVIVLSKLLWNDVNHYMKSSQVIFKFRKEAFFVIHVNSFDGISTDVQLIQTLQMRPEMFCSITAEILIDWEPLHIFNPVINIQNINQIIWFICIYKP